jgi:hypothetical protein
MAALDAAPANDDDIHAAMQEGEFIGITGQGQASS